MRKALLAAALAGIAVLAVDASTTVEAGSARPDAREARCKIVTRVVRGKRRRVRVCPRTPRPRGRPRPRADLAVGASFDPSPALAGGAVTYTLTVRNLGPAPATRTVAAHVIPVEMTATAVTSTQGICALPRPLPPGVPAPPVSAVACRLGNLAAAATASITVVVSVRPITRRLLDVRASVASTPTRDPAPANNSAVVRTPVDGNCDPAYPTICIPPPEPAVACGAVPYSDFPAQAPDPHKLDTDSDGIACESAAGDEPGTPLVGAAYSHWLTVRCSANGAGVLTTYHRPGVRRRVQLQLAAMRAAGIETLRLVIRHQADTAGQPPDVVPSAGGTLVEPYRSNLVRYLQDVRAARFAGLTVDFAPASSNDPATEAWDPARLDENWAFIADIRPLVKQFGPAATRIDLLSGGAPSDLSPARDRVKEYIAELYRRYVDAFGKADVVVSVIAPPDPGADSAQPEAARRLQNLVDAFAASGRGQPQLFSVRISPSQPSADHALYGLRNVDETLAANGLTQPIVISEAAYDDPQIAAAILEFRRTSSRRVLEVQESPRRRGSDCAEISVSPPFSADAYHRALRGAVPPARLTARLDARGLRLTAADGHPASALVAGTYTILVVDRSRRGGVELEGPRVRRTTAARFVGTVRWRLPLRAGTYRVRGVPAGRTALLTVFSRG
jgi:uncharacterized repeat protein (TIGR01451 family)